MREIKFRAWDKLKQEMYSPIHEAYNGKLFELLVSFSGDLSAHTMKGMVHESLFPNQFILMQYTGLKDKNGTEIYEGDIVKHLYFQSETNIGDIHWSEQTLQWKIYYIDGEQDGLMRIDAEWYEVIGNIYENKDLLT